MAASSFKNFLNLINPQPEIGGLEISDSYLRFVLLKNNKADIVSMKMPPGVIEDGKIKDKDQFFSIISNFYNQLSPGSKKKYIIANISDINVYTEVFLLPKSGESNLDEAVNLNLRMISPIDFDNAYTDWQLIGEKISGGVNQLQILGAFVQKKIIDDYEDILSRAGFDVAAVEFPAVALTRSLSELSEGFSKNKNYILMRVGSDGLAFSFISNGNLNFLHFASWASAYGGQRQISFDAMKRVIITEVQKVLSFYGTHAEGKIDSLILVSQTLTDEISKIINDNFPDISVRIPTFREFKNLEPVWFSTVGSALRGVIPRSEDSVISLLSAGTEIKFRNYQIVAFINIWRNIILSVLGAIIVFYIGLDFLIMKNFDVLSQKVKAISIPDFANITELQNEARDFNQKANLIYAAYAQKSIWSPFFVQLNQLAGSDISIKRILVQSVDSPVLLVGEAPDEDKIVTFKDALESQSQFTNINFQLSNISKNVSGNVDFTLTFELKSVK